MINLLPKEEKEKIKKEENFTLIVLWQVFFILFLCFNLFFLFSAKIYLSFLLEKEKILLTEKEQIFRIFGLKEIEEKIDRLNSLVTKTSRFYKDELLISQIFTRILEKKPEGIYFKNITIEKDKIFLQGFAKTREQFLSFKKNLEEDKLIKELDFPVELLLKKSDFDFVFNLTLNQ